MSTRGHHGLLLSEAGGGGGTAYNALISALSPLMWWRHDETTGFTANDSSGNSYTGTSTFDFSNVGVTVGPPSGYAGLSNGHTSCTVQSVTDSALDFGGSATDAWTIIKFMTGSAAGAQYALSRAGNNVAMIYGFVSGNVELFSSATDTRTGSQIPLSHIDTTTPHMIVYRYDNTAYTGWLDGVQIFSTTRSLTLGTGLARWTDNGGEGAPSYNGIGYDTVLFDYAISDTDIADLYAARNNT